MREVPKERTRPVNAIPPEAIRKMTKGGKGRFGNSVSQTKLATIIGFSVITINKWRTFFDDFPQPDAEHKMYDVQKVWDWLEKHPEAGQNSVKMGKKREDLMCENLEKKNKLLEQQIEEADGLLVKIDRVMSVFKSERSVLVESFRKRILSEMPSELEGKSAREISSRLDDAFTHFLEDVQSSIPRIIASTQL